MINSCERDKNTEIVRVEVKGMDHPRARLLRPSTLDHTHSKKIQFAKL